MWDKKSTKNIMHDFNKKRGGGDSNQFSQKIIFLLRKKHDFWAFFHCFHTHNIKNTLHQKWTSIVVYGINHVYRMVYYIG